MPTKTLLAMGAALTAMGAVMSPQAAIAQERPGALKLTVHQAKPGVYWVEGGVSNTGFVVGDKGVVVIDAQKTEEAAAAALAEIAKITPKPVNALILSHVDPDHVGGVPAYPKGTEIIAQENTRAAVIASASDPTAPPPLAEMYRKLAGGYLPTHVVAGSEKLTIDGVRMQILYIAPAHSSGDLVVYLPDQKVVFAGDVVTTNTGLFPVIHIGGSSLGWIETMKAILALDADVVVTGHGDLETRAQLIARLKRAEERRAAIRTLVYQNKTLDEVKAALPDTPLAPMFPTFTQTTYQELVKGYPAEARGPWVNLIRKP